MFGVAGALQDYVRTSKTLDVLGVLWLNFTSLRLEQAQASGGAFALLTFRINFQARL